MKKAIKHLSIILTILICFCLPFVLVGCGGKSHKIDIEAIIGGSIRVSNTYAKAGETVDIEIETNNGYTLDHVTLNGNILDGSSFTMPNSDVVLSALFTKNEYTITYHLSSDEINNPLNPTTYNVETPTIELLAPQKPGYTFKGWFKNEIKTIETSYITKGSYGNIDLYPDWEKTVYTITYILDSGTLDPTSPRIFYFDYGKLDLPPATKENFEFEGWYEDPNFNGDPIGYIDAKTCRSYVLYAKFVSTSEEDGYRIITNQTDLIEILKDKENLNKKLRLKANLDLSGIKWQPVGTEEEPFTGEFDGNGFRIDNITITDITNLAGLFAFADGATIKNLTITFNFDINSISDPSSVSIGGLIGRTGENETTIENCCVIPLRNEPSRIVMNVAADSVSVGSIVGFAGLNTNLVLCHVLNTNISANAKNEAFVGGLTGHNGNIDRCAYEDTIGTMIYARVLASSAFVGGLSGSSNLATITNSYYASTSKLYAKSFAASGNSTIHIGGLVGQLIGGRVSCCYANISSIVVEQETANENLCVGGAFGSITNSRIVGCIATGLSTSTITISVEESLFNPAEAHICYLVGNFESMVSSEIITSYSFNAITISVNGENLVTPSNSADRVVAPISGISFILDFINSPDSIYDDEIWTKTEYSFPTLF